MRTQKETDLQEENERLRARVAELEADLDSAEEYICELKAEQEGK